MADKEVWTILKTLNWTKRYFKDKGIENPSLDAELLLCEVLHCQRITLFVDFERPLSEQELATFKGYVVRRAKAEPLAYILGHKEFMGLSFKVTPATLIPRPETELLVESIVKAAKLLRPEGEVKLLDIGTGSGAIVVAALAALPKAKGVGADISIEALTVAKENADNQGLQGRIGFIRSDIYSRIPLDKKFDIIVSNPPYIPTATIAELAADVKKEPLGALDGGKDGLDFYRRIIAEADLHLEEEGLLALEIGIGQSEAVVELCRKAGFTLTAVRKDYADIERMVFAVKAKEEGEKYADLLLAITQKWC